MSDEAQVAIEQEAFAAGVKAVEEGRKEDAPVDVEQALTDAINFSKLENASISLGGAVDEMSLLSEMSEALHALLQHVEKNQEEVAVRIFDGKRKMIEARTAFFGEQADA